jgi:hypothetical protein
MLHPNRADFHPKRANFQHFILFKQTFRTKHFIQSVFLPVGTGASSSKARCYDLPRGRQSLGFSGGFACALSQRWRMSASRPWPRRNRVFCSCSFKAFPMALAARLLSRRAARTGASLLSSNPAHSCASAPALSSADEISLLSRCLSTFSLPDSDLVRRNEVARFQGLSRLVPFGRVYSTSVVDGGVGEDAAQTVVEEAKAPIKPPPRPFKLNDEQRKLAEEIGYKVVDRYTEEDFGQNKRPKAFAVVQVCFSLRVRFSEFVSLNKIDSYYSLW